jgi:hypothetical protein
MCYLAKLTIILLISKNGEVHIGDSWLLARDWYCQNKTDMPVGLIVFGDKSHTDIHERCH